VAKEDGSKLDWEKKVKVWEPQKEGHFPDVILISLKIVGCKLNCNLERMSSSSHELYSYTLEIHIH
jgi:hypothetical protein